MTAPAHVLVVDDQDYVLESLEAMLADRGHHVTTASSVEEALQRLAQSLFDVVLTDLQLPGADGLDLIGHLSGAAPGVPVLVLTGHGTVASAVACMKAGAFDYLEKPADPEALLMAVDKAVEWRLVHRELEIRRRTAEVEDDEPVGECPAWRHVMSLVDAAARADSPVLVLGESGSGKEVVARTIHARSGRAEKPFVPVNCAALPVELFESEFFGHVKGAFTGATSDREGRFLLAHGGTLFLDELTCLPPAAQAKLLRVLQDGQIERVGDARRFPVDVRIIAATNSDLDAEAEAGRFRRDLLWRLDVVRIALPPLRDRREDIPLLAARLLPRVAARANARVDAIHPETLRALADYDWPGNVRELQNVLERAVLLERSDVLRPGSLPFGGARELTAEADRDAVEELGLREAALRAERAVIVEALRRSGGVRAEAARLLGVDPRNLPHYLKKHDVR